MDLLALDADLDVLDREGQDLTDLSSTVGDTTKPCVLDEGAGDLDPDFLARFLLDEEEPSGANATTQDSSTRRNHESSSPSSSTTSSVTGSEQHEELKEQRLARLANNARRHRRRKKNERLELQEQVTALTSQLELLQSEQHVLYVGGRPANWREIANDQRKKRRHAEQLNEQLKRALCLQRGFVGELRSVFSNSPMSSSELNMRYLLHTYTRLGTTPAARVADCQAVCSYSKLDLAMQILTRETAGISIDTPSFVARNMRLAPHEFGATTVGVYALDTLDVAKVFTAACSVILGCGTDLPNYSLTCAQAEAVETPANHIQYGVSAAKYRSDTDGAEVAIEGRGISGYRITGRYAVLVWDFVDIDDLYPIKKETDVKRDAVGAILVRQEQCEDGEERIVCRTICTKIHSLGSAAISPDIMHFSQHTRLGAETCSCEVYHQIQERSMACPL